MSGAGSDIEDRIHASLSPGEYVLDAQATRQIGVGRLDQLNKGQRPATAAPVAHTAPIIRIHVTADSAIAGQAADELARKIARAGRDAIAAYGPWTIASGA